MAVTKKHSELSGSSLHNPKGIDFPVGQEGTTGAVLTLDIDNKKILPKTSDTDIGNDAVGESFKDIHISGDIYKNNYLYTGTGGGGNGIFSKESHYYDHNQEANLTDRYEATGSLAITGSLSVLGPIDGNFTLGNLDTPGNLEVGQTITASASNTSTMFFGTDRTQAVDFDGYLHQIRVYCGGYLSDGDSQRVTVSKNAEERATKFWIVL